MISSTFHAGIGTSLYAALFGCKVKIDLRSYHFPKKQWEISALKNTWKGLVILVEVMTQKNIVQEDLPNQTALHDLSTSTCDGTSQPQFPISCICSKESIEAHVTNADDIFISRIVRQIGKGDIAKDLM